MPIAVPKIPFRGRSIDDTFMPSIDERFYLERTLFLYGEIKQDPLVNRIISLLLYFDLENDTDIFFYINCRGGELLPAISVFNLIEFLFSDVCTMVIGLAASGASLILAAGTHPKRVAFPHARIMIHQPATGGSFHGTPLERNPKERKRTPTEIKKEAEEMFELRKTIAELYAQQTSQPIDVIQNDLEWPTYMSAKQAQDYGIVDRIIEKKDRFNSS